MKGGACQGEQMNVRTSCRYANIPQPVLPPGEGEQDSLVPLPQGEGFRVRADKGVLPMKGERCLDDSLPLMLIL